MLTFVLIDPICLRPLPLYCTQVIPVALSTPCSPRAPPLQSDTLCAIVPSQAKLARPGGLIEEFAIEQTSVSTIRQGRTNSLLSRQPVAPPPTHTTFIKPRHPSTRHTHSLSRQPSSDSFVVFAHSCSLLLPHSLPNATGRSFTDTLTTSVRFWPFVFRCECLSFWASLRHRVIHHATCVAF